MYWYQTQTEKMQKGKYLTPSQNEKTVSLTLVMLNKLRCHTHLIFSQSDYLIQIVYLSIFSEFKTLLRVLFECAAHGVLVREEKVR